MVPGAGLANGSEVTPLLAGRLTRAREMHNRLSRRDRQPVVLVSGGRGSDEKLPERAGGGWVFAWRTGLSDQGMRRRRRAGPACAGAGEPPQRRCGGYSRRYVSLKLVPLELSAPVRAS